MAFVKEYPVSQELLNRFDWTALPLLYQGEAGQYCSVPHTVLVDYERDLVGYTGGGSGRTTGIIQPFTEVLYYKGTPVRFIYQVSNSKSHKDEKTGLYVFDWEEWTIIKINMPIILRKEENCVFDALKDYCCARALSKNTKKITVKIMSKVEYI